MHLNDQYQGLLEATKRQSSPTDHRSNERPDRTKLEDSAIEKLKIYDTDGQIAATIRSGAGSRIIFDFLKQNLKWNDDAWDFLTRTDVEIPRGVQKQKWSSFELTLYAINDLDIK